RPFTGRVAPHVARRQYVQKRDFTDAIRLVQRQPMSCARSPVVAGQKKAVITQRGHHLRLILSHGAEGIIDVLWAALRRTDTVAVAPQVCGEDVIPPGEGAGDLMQAEVGLRVVMEQQQWLRSAAIQGDYNRTLRW